MLLSIVANCVLVALAVLLHFESLHRLSRLMPHLPVRPHFRIVVGVVGALLAHTAEIWVFAVGYHLMHHSGQFGHLAGNYSGEFLDAVYFSFTVFTTVGFGDIEPAGLLRFLTGIESLTGLVLITWSASFLYYEMQRYWERP